MKKLLIVTLIILPLALIAAGIELYPPVDNPRVTSTFGEFRPLGNRGPHFHMGVDFSTDRRQGVDIKAAADGWLVRIVIDEDDIYGYTVVLQHEGGYRSLYAHLSDFSPKLKEIVEDVKKTFKGKRITIEFNEGDVFFHKGDVIGKSGSTGEALKPHCHFEVRDTSEEKSYDPMALFKEGVVPRPPDEKIIMQYLTINGSTVEYVEGAEYRFRGNHPDLEILAYSIGNGNRLGLKEIRMYLNGEILYDISFESIPWNEFNNITPVYDKERSRMNVEEYTAWYILYPRGYASPVKINNYPKVKRFPSKSEIKIELYDAWGMKKIVYFYLRRVR